MTDKMENGKKLKEINIYFIALNLKANTVTPIVSLCALSPNGHW